MAIAPKDKKAAKKAPAKKVAKKVAKKAPASAQPKAPKAVKAPKESGPTRHSRITELLIDRKHTDQEIFDIITKEFGDCHRPMISISRWTMNKDLKDKLEPMFRDEKGKLMRKSERPAKEKKVAGKASAARDKLAKVGIKTAARKVVKKVAKKAAE